MNIEDILKSSGQLETEGERGKDGLLKYLLLMKQLQKFYKKPTRSHKGAIARAPTRAPRAVSPRSSNVAHRGDRPMSSEDIERFPVKDMIAPRRPLYRKNPSAQSPVETERHANSNAARELPPRTSFNDQGVEPPYMEISEEAQRREHLQNQERNPKAYALAEYNRRPVGFDAPMQTPSSDSDYEGLDKLPEVNRPISRVGSGRLQRPEPYKEDRLVPSNYRTSPANRFLGKDWTEMWQKKLHGTDQLSDSGKRGIGQKIYDSGEESGRIGKGGGSPDYKEWEGHDYAELPPSEVGGEMRPEEELYPENQTTLEKFGYGLGAFAGSAKRLAKKGYNFAGSALDSYYKATGDPLREKEDEFDPEWDYTEPPEEEEGGRSWKDFLSTDGKLAGEKLGTAIGSGVKKASNAMTNFSRGLSGENEGYGNFGRLGRGIRDIGTNLSSGFNSAYGEEDEIEPEARDLGLFAKSSRIPRDESGDSPGVFDEQREQEHNPEMDELLKDTPISRKIGEYAGAGVRGVQDFTKHLGRASEQFEKGIGGDEAYGRAGAAGKGIYNFASALAGSNEGYGGLGKAGAGIRHFGAAVKDKLAEAGSWAARSGRGFLRGVPKGWREWGT